MTPCWLEESQPEGSLSVGLMLMEWFRATWQRNVSSVSLGLDVCCERPEGSTVSSNRTEGLTAATKENEADGLSAKRVVVVVVHSLPLKCETTAASEQDANTRPNRILLINMLILVGHSYISRCGRDIQNPTAFKSQSKARS